MYGFKLYIHTIAFSSQCYSITGFDNSDEAAVIERLLGAFGEGDEEEIVKCTTDPVYKCMDNDVSVRSCDLVYTYLTAIFLYWHLKVIHKILLDALAP